jgi:hypothetical protein
MKTGCGNWKERSRLRRRLTHLKVSWETLGSYMPEELLRDPP